MSAALRDAIRQDEAVHQVHLTHLRHAYRRLRGGAPVRTSGTARPHSSAQVRRTPVIRKTAPPPFIQKTAPSDGGWIGEYWALRNPAQETAFAADAWCALCNNTDRDRWGQAADMVYCDNEQDHAFHLTCYGYWNRCIRKKRLKKIFETFPLLRRNVLFEPDNKTVKASHRAAAASKTHEWKPTQPLPKMPTQSDLWFCSMPRCVEAQTQQQAALATSMRAERLDPDNERDRRKFFQRQRAQ